MNRLDCGVLALGESLLLGIGIRLHTPWAVMREDGKLDGEVEWRAGAEIANICSVVRPTCVGEGTKSCTSLGYKSSFVRNLKAF